MASRRRYSDKIRALSGAAAAVGMAQTGSAVIQAVNADYTMTGGGHLYFEGADATGGKIGQTEPAQPFSSIYNSLDGYFYVQNYQNSSTRNDPNLEYAINAGDSSLLLMSPGDWIDGDLAYTDSPGGVWAYPSFDIYDLPGYNTYYFGYRLLNQGVGANETWYGYMELEVYNETGGTENDTLTLKSQRFDDSGADIQIVPEPSTALLLVFACAAALFAGFRRKLSNTTF